jgi:sRNA-binding regulator protein Hfq
MDNNKVQFHRPSAVNRYLEIAKQTKVPLAVYFSDGEVLDECLVMESDTFNLLLKVVATGLEVIATRSTIKKITSTAENNFLHKRKVAQ